MINLISSNHELKETFPCAFMSMCSYVYRYICVCWGYLLYGGQGLKQDVSLNRLFPKAGSLAVPSAQLNESR